MVFWHCRVTLPLTTHPLLWSLSAESPQSTCAGQNRHPEPINSSGDRGCTKALQRALLPCSTPLQALGSSLTTAAECKETIVARGNTTVRRVEHAGATAGCAPPQQALDVGVHAHADAAPDEEVGDVAQAAVADRAHALEAEEAVVAHQPLVPRVCGGRHAKWGLNLILHPPQPRTSCSTLLHGQAVNMPWHRSPLHLSAIVLCVSSHMQGRACNSWGPPWRVSMCPHHRL